MTIKPFWPSSSRGCVASRKRDRRNRFDVKFQGSSFALLCGAIKRSLKQPKGQRGRFWRYCTWRIQRCVSRNRICPAQCKPTSSVCASGTVQNSDLRNAKRWIGLSGQHDTPLERAGAQHSQSPTDAKWGGDEPYDARRAQSAGQYCSRPQRN
jgi:hypothetical protein